MNRVFLDMDGVLADFDALKTRLGLTGDEMKRLPGAFSFMHPVPGAIHGVASIIGMGYDVWIATKPPTGVAHAYAEKAGWIFRHLPELSRKIIMTHDKGLLGDELDYIVDDRIGKANVMHFRGRIVPFGPSEKITNWTMLVDYFRRQRQERTL